MLCPSSGSDKSTSALSWSWLTVCFDIGQFSDVLCINCFFSSREHIRASDPFMLATYASFVSAIGMSFSAADYAAGAISLVLFYRNMIR